MSDSTKQLARATIRVLIVDDHEIVRKGLCSMLSEEEDFEVVGQTGSGNLAVTLAIQLQPDIVLLDIFLGSCNGLDIAQQLQRGCPESRIVILTGIQRKAISFLLCALECMAIFKKHCQLTNCLMLCTPCIGVSVLSVNLGPLHRS